MLQIDIFADFSPLSGRLAVLAVNFDLQNLSKDRIRSIFNLCFNFFFRRSAQRIETKIEMKSAFGLCTILLIQNLLKPVSQIRLSSCLIFQGYS